MTRIIHPNKGDDEAGFFSDTSERTAVVLGATGLVGSHLVQRLLEDNRFGKIKVFTRRNLAITSEKLEEHIVDFEDAEQWKHLVQGDVLFSALGTTRRKAGGKKAQFRVDFHYQYEFARIAAKNGMSAMVLVSSIGAAPNSKLFYPRIKGKLEQEVALLGFKHLVIIRPGPLYGPRPERRTGEAFGVFVIRALNRLGMMKKYRPIHGDQVAAAMIRSLLHLKREPVIWSDQEVV